MLTADLQRLLQLPLGFHQVPMGLIGSRKECQAPRQELLITYLLSQVLGLLGVLFQKR